MLNPVFFNESELFPVMSFRRETECLPYGVPICSTYTIKVAEPATKKWLDEAIMKIFGIESRKAPKAKQVILNDPATVVIWEDGTKTVTKAQDGDEYDDKVGLLLCGVIKASNNRVRAVDFEDAIRAVAKLDERQMRALSAALEVTADNFGEEDE